MRFRGPAAGANAPGKQFGFMYFPTADERQNGIQRVSTDAPLMAEHGTYGTQPGNTYNGPAPAPYGQNVAGGNVSMPQPQAPPLGGQQLLPSPPPTYAAAKNETYRPVSDNACNSLTDPS
jgi:hypothetical protein